MTWFIQLQIREYTIMFQVPYIMHFKIPGTEKSSVADPGCLSRIPDPEFYPSRIPDLGFWIQKQQQKRGMEKNLLL
jgi:hypothetical protein